MHTLKTIAEIVIFFLSIPWLVWAIFWMGEIADDNLLRKMK
jgi:hypothetical protein